VSHAKRENPSNRRHNGSRAIERDTHRKGDGKKRFAKVVEALRSGGVSLIFEKKVEQDREKGTG
jgi:hypothetical protein